MKVISTFAGCGGSSTGYKLAGFEVLAAVEWEQHAVDTYRLNHPKTSVLHEDIAKVDVDRLMSECSIKTGELDIFDGSPPCQGFSVANYQKKAGDNRNELFREYVRLLRGLMPRYFVMENVVGMVQMKDAFRVIMGELKASGYEVQARVLNACAYGVPQHRRRVIIIGARDGVEHPGHPAPDNAIRGCKRLDERAARYSPRAHFHALISEGEVSPAVLKGGGQALFWTPVAELGPKSYSYIGSFPGWYRWEGTHAQIKNRIGNCVPPLLMKAVAERIAGVRPRLDGKVNIRGMRLPSVSKQQARNRRGVVRKAAQKRV